MKTATEIMMKYQAESEAIRKQMFINSLDPAQAMDWREAHMPSKEDIEILLDRCVQLANVLDNL